MMLMCVWDVVCECCGDVVCVCVCVCDVVCCVRLMCGGMFENF